MYPPPYYHTSNRAQLQAFLQQHYFGLLLTSHGGLSYTPLPFLFDWQLGTGQAYCHLARNNPQLSQLDGLEVKVVVQGPHAFVPASCYQQQPAVSTWNYSLVELTGTARLLDAGQTLALVRKQEAHSAPAMLQAADYQQKLVQAIVGVEINLSSIAGRFKLSQNKAPAEQQAVIDYLQQSEQPATVWQLMRNLYQGQ
ncbi:MAG: FMN-binding negative transcriptional regulator [Gammaproteobacteria bacterium]|nr:FMN-binding negative transcriptional regulator [Gammaproteobacteria bacterium]MBU1553453.1 FMN-binding negative transcriptional regulator [Gammaproteobacteria bacterium]MBU2070739.1 FMN-binding negative transcriptional regulator [Gammaproteobacteria bacterium]MBU2182730.1 FMN-binding negative transcriptional regulator [Gammaproteobacteria bacterium]MBU2206028.1 FMN-binding negative transcriptional regulator [Gammaproteobacteria bacterium]